MPGSTENACPGVERLAVAADDVGVFVLLDADAVAGAMDEVRAVAAVGDDAAGDAVDVLARRADGRGVDRGRCASCSTAYRSRNSPAARRRRSTRSA